MIDGLEIHRIFGSRRRQWRTQTVSNGGFRIVLQAFGGWIEKDGAARNRVGHRTVSYRFALPAKNQPSTESKEQNQKAHEQIHTMFIHEPSDGLKNIVNYEYWVIFHVYVGNITVMFRAIGIARNSRYFDDLGRSPIQFLAQMGVESRPHQSFDIRNQFSY